MMLGNKVYLSAEAQKSLFEVANRQYVDNEAKNWTGTFLCKIKNKPKSSDKFGLIFLL